MKYLRHKRSGKLVVYDETLLSLGSYEVYEPPKPLDEDKVCAADSLSICLIRSTGESIQCET